MLARYFRLLLICSFLAIMALASPFTSYAQNGVTEIDTPEITLKPVIGFKTINQATSTLISFMFLGAGLIAFFYITRGAMKYISAGDNAANAQAARTTIQNAVIGLFIIAAVYVLFKVLVNIIPGLGEFFS